MSKGLAAAGASVVIAGRNKTKAQSALLELRSLGAQAEIVELDVLKEASCHQALEHAVERFGRHDILVNNAGATVPKQPEDLTAGDWHLVMDTNLTSAFSCSGSLSPHGARRWRQNHQYGVDDVCICIFLCHPLCGQQGRHGPVGEVDGCRMGEGQYPGQYN